MFFGDFTTVAQRFPHLSIQSPAHSKLVKDFKAAAAGVESG